MVRLRPLRRLQPNKGSYGVWGERERERCGDMEGWRSRGGHASVHVHQLVMLRHVAHVVPYSHPCVSLCLSLTRHPFLYNHWILFRSSLSFRISNRIAPSTRHLYTYNDPLLTCRSNVCVKNKDDNYCSRIKSVSCQELITI